MLLGTVWKERLHLEKAEDQALQGLEQLKTEQQRAEAMITLLQLGIAKTTEHRYMVMELKEGETRHNFGELYGEQFSSSEEFLGTAKSVVDYCLANGLDVYVWEHDFEMSLGPFGAEIWVTPCGIPYHQGT